MEYEAVIGLEVHVQLNTRTKIFCNCSTEFGASPNSHVCPVCMGQPGVLPVLNKEVLSKSIRAGLALHGKISQYSKFDRKNYFYPDLPKGYQVSQFDFPIVEGGYIDIDLEDGSVKRIGITRAHMEEDAGKLVHSEGNPYSLVDLNRAGTPLLEIVSEPDMRSADEAYAYLSTLKKSMKYVGVSDVNMEEGSLRCDANVSIRPVGQEKLGTRVEIKNMNSFNGVRKAINYEIQRQIYATDNGEKIVQETRLFDVDQGKTFPMRGKEEANDYRYFPEPDLPPIKVTSEEIESARGALPELPREKFLRFQKQYGLSSQDALTLTEEKELADYFEAVLPQLKAEVKKAANWVMGEVLGSLNQMNISIDEYSRKMTPQHLAGLINLIEEGTISGKIAKEVYGYMLESGQTAQEIVKSKGLQQVSDSGELEKAVKQVLEANPVEVERYKKGETKLLGFFVGQVMKATRGQGNPGAVNEILRKMLG